MLRTSHSLRAKCEAKKKRAAPRPGSDTFLCALIAFESLFLGRLVLLTLSAGLCIRPRREAHGVTAEGCENAPHDWGIALIGNIRWFGRGRTYVYLLGVARLHVFAIILGPYHRSRMSPLALSLSPESAHPHNRGAVCVTPVKGVFRHSLAGISPNGSEADARSETATPTREG